MSVRENDKEIVIWGAGGKGRELLEHLEFDVKCVVDSDPTKWGRKDYNEIPIVSFDEYLAKYRNDSDFFYITCGDYFCISERLQEHSIKHEYWMGNFIYGDPQNLFVDTYTNRKMSFDSKTYYQNFDKSDEEAINYFTDVLYDSTPMFNHIEIETLNRCNGVCQFCPVNRKNDIRPMGKMSESLFGKIIAELKSMNYRGCISLFSNNEPLLDERIIDFHKYIRNELPHAKIHLFTNGTLLTVEKFVELIEYLDELIINNYSKELKMMNNIVKIHEFCENDSELRKKVTIVMRNPEEVLETRAGTAPNRGINHKNPYREVKCTHPFRQIIVRPNGLVSLCCNDAVGKTTMGDLNNQSLIEVWQGEQFAGVREALYKDGRKSIPFCTECDSLRLV